MDPRYPIGIFSVDEQRITDIQRNAFIQEIEELPTQLKQAVVGLSNVQLDTPYREGGWTLRQVVHHIADSHMNAYIRVRLALTEDNPIIKPYKEEKWAELIDARTASVECSIAIVEAIHLRWVLLLHSLTLIDFKRTFIHPESGTSSIDKYIALYAWHGKHHVAHITSLRDKMGWVSL